MAVYYLFQKLAKNDRRNASKMPLTSVKIGLVGLLLRVNLIGRRGPIERAFTVKATPFEFAEHVQKVDQLILSTVSV